MWNSKFCLSYKTFQTGASQKILLVQLSDAAFCYKEITYRGEKTGEKWLILDVSD